MADFCFIDIIPDLVTLETKAACDVISLVVAKLHTNVLVLLSGDYDASNSLQAAPQKKAFLQLANHIKFFIFCSELKLLFQDKRLLKEKEGS